MPNGQILQQFPEVPGQAIPNTKLLLLDGVTAISVGSWMPWSPFSKGSLEVSNAPGAPGMNATVKLWFSNAVLMPANGFMIEVAGTINPGDVGTVKINSYDFLNGVVEAQYTVQDGDDAPAVAAGLVTALKAAIQAASQVLANPEYGANRAGVLQVSSETDDVTVKWQEVLEPVSVNTNVTGALTLTVTEYDSGEGFELTSCARTSPGMVQFQQDGSWIKSSCPTYTAGDLSAIVQATAP